MGIRGSVPLKLCLRFTRSQEMIMIVLFILIIISIFFKAQSDLSPSFISATNAFLLNF